ncbi:MAG: hypothetical protein M1154_09485 [Gammaproteobacteria bacterium]|nr:hypothetical protein [Gammaproteobacteria bacterium]
MKHVDKCEKCGKEYKPEVEDARKDTTKCGACGAEVYEHGSPSPYEVEGENDEHLVEKGLRKVTKGITGNKK